MAAVAPGVTENLVIAPTCDLPAQFPRTTCTHDRMYIIDWENVQMFAFNSAGGIEAWFARWNLIFWKNKQITYERRLWEKLSLMSQMYLFMHLVIKADERSAFWCWWKVKLL